MKAEAFVVHLARAHGRARQVERLKKTLPMPVTVIDAVDAATLTDEEIATSYRPRLHRPYYPFQLRRTEIACFLSHRLAWRAILDRGMQAGLVIEDDVDVGGRFADMLSVALAHATPRDYVRFPKLARERGRTLVKEAGLRLFEPLHPGLGMQAALVGSEAARELLAATAIFDRPVDTTVQMRWLHAARVLTTAPVTIREVAGELGGTTVQKTGKPFGEILMREFRRACYRFAARACAVRRTWSAGKS